MSGDATAVGAALSEGDLRQLDELVEAALAAGDESALPILGYGEISLVLAWPREAHRFACKRLPPFRDHERFETYRETLADYVETLRAAGLRVVETEMRGVDHRDGTVAGYVVQPMLPSEQLAPNVVRRSDPEAGHPLVQALAAAVERTVSPSLGLDAQLSNWTWSGGELTYLDVSTPLIWCEGRSRLDLDLLADAYPAIMRWPLRRFVAPGILETYRERRKVYLDFAGNLLKEGLDPWLPRFLEAMNRCISKPLSAEEVRRYYRSDKRLWAALLVIRRLDRVWRRRVRRRPYPFLLPGRIER